MNFGQMVEGLKSNNGLGRGFEPPHANTGRRFGRPGWNGKGMWIAAQFPDRHSKMSSPYLFMKTADGKLVPWLPSQSDVFAEDWEELDS